MLRVSNEFESSSQALSDPPPHVVCIPVLELQEPSSNETTCVAHLCCMENTVPSCRAHITAPLPPSSIAVGKLSHRAGSTTKNTIAKRIYCSTKVDIREAVKSAIFSVYVGSRKMRLHRHYPRIRDPLGGNEAIPSGLTAALPWLSETILNESVEK